MPVPKIPPKGASRILRREGVADPRYLLAEIEELKAIADKGGLGTLANLLECAAIEARAQVEQLDIRHEDGSECD